LNIALGSILLISLLAPGFILRLAYVRGSSSKRAIQTALTIDTSLVNQIIFSAIPSLLIHLGSLFVIQQLGVIFRAEPDLYIIYKIIDGEGLLDQKEFEVIRMGLSSFALYNVILIFLSYRVGKLFRRFVILTGLDLRNPFLRVNNDWYYVFENITENTYPQKRTLKFYLISIFRAIFQFNKHKPERDFDLVYLEVLANIDGREPVIYSGILEDFYLSKTTGLERIQMTAVYSRPYVLGESISAPELAEPEGESYRTTQDTDILIIPYERISNIKVSYFSLDLVGAVEDTAKSSSSKS
ncbi:MAG: hypothetical protein AAGC85_27595, partial [Bacteroidota bacterium]